MSTPQITITGDKMAVHFSDFDEVSYGMFLKVKSLPEYEIQCDHPTLTYTVKAPARFAEMLGVTISKPAISDLPYLPALMDDQGAIVPTALEAKRFAIWADCGLGKTLMGLEWARHVIHRTSGRVLIFTFKNIINQWIEETETFYGPTLPIAVLDSREELIEWCAGRGPQAGTLLAITNYEKLNHENLEDQQINEMRLLAGIIADESSRLRTGGGSQKWALIKSSKGIEYKLSLTATPAPNDPMEYASQAAFLEKLRDENEIIWTYFTRDPVTNEWTVKAHARDAFYRFMASWSIYIRNPKAYGWRLNVPDVPEPIVTEYTIRTTEEQRDWIGRHRQNEAGNFALFNTERSNTIERAKLSQVAKGFVYRSGENGKYTAVASNKPAFVANLIKQELDAGHQVLVWTSFNAESDILGRLLEANGCAKRCAIFSGATPEGRRDEVLEQFRHGHVPCLVSKPSMLGYGLNFQHCTSMIFSGFTDSYEQFYQAWRRAVRYGQQKRVRIHIPYIPELEGEALANIWKKRARHETDIREAERAYIAAAKDLRRAA